LNRTERTYRFELWRASTAGIIETAASTFLLLIAVQWFHAGAWAKGILAAGASLGLLLSPAVVAWVTAAGWATSQAAASIVAVGCASFFLAAVVQRQWPFVAASVVAMASSAAIIPLLTQMYQENYPEKERGRRFSRTVMVRIATAALFSKAAGDALNGHLQRYPALLVIFAVAFGVASFCLSRCPTSPIHCDESPPLRRAWRFVREDHLFRRTLICWMLMGFANLMMLPLRVEYLANPKYHQTFSVGKIALLTGVIPNVVRLVLSPVWGYLFDHMNFFALRATLNLGFAIGILTFFLSDSFVGLVAGAMIYGVSNAGGDVAWSLWVTKFAPAQRVADYMSVHTFLTGVRGVLAPLCAFSLVEHWAPWVMALLSSALIVAASLLLLPEIRLARKARTAPALVEEISE
jgi:hypothetical protein